MSSGVSVADLADVEETFGDLAVRESATVQQTHQSRQQTTEHVTTREVVTTTTEVTQGYYDEDGTFREETKTREQIVKEAFDESMTAEQRDAYEKMVRERNAAATLERGVRALQDSLRPPEEIEEEDFTEALPARGTPPPSPPRQERSGRGDDSRAPDRRGEVRPSGAVRRRRVPARGVHRGPERGQGPAPGRDFRARAFDGHLGASLERMRLVVGRACKINVRAADNYGNARSTGGDRVEGVLDGPSGETGEVKVVDHGDGTYGLEFHCTSQGVWTLRLKFNGRLSSQRHELVVSHGPLTAKDLEVKQPEGPYLCGGYTDVIVEVKRPELGRTMSGAEAFSFRVISPSAMSMSVPLELEPGATRAVGTVCWPEVGEHSISVTLDGAVLPRCPMTLCVLPEDICLAACQIQGAGTHRAVAGERATFVVRGARRARQPPRQGRGAALGRRADARGRPRRGRGDAGADFGLRQRRVRGVVRDPGRGSLRGCAGADERGARDEGPLRARSRDGERVRVARGRRPGPRGGRARALLDRAPGRVRQPRAVAPGAARASVLGGRPRRDGRARRRGAEGRSDVVASASVAGRYFLTVVGGDNQDPVPGSPFELVAYPGAASAASSVTSVYGAQLASPESDVLTAVAGDEVTLVVAPRDAFGNPTVFGPGSGVRVTASGGQGQPRCRSRIRAAPARRRRSAAP